MVLAQHSADYGPTAPGDGMIDFDELNRVIELYNYRNGTVRTGEYHTQSGTVDGFTTGPGAISTYHSSDYDPADGSISLFELLRIIELYNYRNGSVRTGEYHIETGTEDGFAPGSAPPSFYTSPLGHTIMTEESWTFSFVINGSIPISYQWRKDGIAITGATASTYDITDAAVADSGIYTVVATNSIGSACSEEATLTVIDYYNGATPTVSLLGGDNQYTYVSEFNAVPFDVAIWNTAGTEPLVNAPVSFSVTQGGGVLAATTNSTTSSLLRLYTDADGTVQLFYKQPSSANIVSHILMTAGAAQLTLTSTSVSAGDSDSNGLPDLWEYIHYGHIGVSSSGDPDNDGLTNLQEYQHGTDPNNSDSDGDGLRDNWEVAYGLNPLVNDASADPDGDGLSNLQEYRLGRNPSKGAIADPGGAVNLRIYSPTR